MRRSPLHLNKWMAFVLTASMLMIGVWTVSPVSRAVALNAAATDAPTHQTERTTMRWQDGKVTDGDGFIGNGSWGADRAPARRMHAMRRMARSIRDMHIGQTGARSNTATLTVSAMMPDTVQDGTVDPGHARDGDVNGDANRSMTAPSEPQTAQRDGVNEQDSMGGALPWVITALAAVAVVLVILAFVPKKSRSR